MTIRRLPDESPMFAVAMPAFNAASTLAEAVESVLAQTFQSWELVIVDDGSTDRTLSIAEAYAAADSRIRVVHQANAGCGPARSVAIDNSSGPCIVHFDADDVLLPGCLEAYAGFISGHSSFDIFSCNAEVFGQPGPVARYHAGERFDAVTEFGLEEMLDRCLIMSVAAVFTRDIYQRVGGIRPNARTEDYDLWLRAMAAGGRHVYFPEVLARHREGSGQMTASVEATMEGTAESLWHLAASGVLDDRLTRLASASACRFALLARRHRAAAAREAYEARLCRGDLRDARREFLTDVLRGCLLVRPGGFGAAKAAAAAPMVMASPGVYAAYLRRKSARHYVCLARRHRAAVAREALEARLCRGDLRDARQEFLRVRLAYHSAARFAVAAPVVMVSPQVYAAYLRVRARHGAPFAAAR